MTTKNPRTYTDAQESALLSGHSYAHGSKRVLEALHAKGLTKVLEKTPEAHEPYRAELTKEGWAAQDQVRRERGERYEAQLQVSKEEHRRQVAEDIRKSEEEYRKSLRGENPKKRESTRAIKNRVMR